MNRVPLIATRNWRYATGFAIIGMALLGYVIAQASLSTGFVRKDWILLVCLLIFQTATLCFAVYIRNQLPDHIRHNLHFVTLFAGVLLLSLPGFVVLAISTHVAKWIVYHVTGDWLNMPKQSNTRQLLYHLAAGALSYSVTLTYPTALSSAVFLPIAIVAVASYLAIYYALSYGAQKLRWFGSIDVVMTKSERSTTIVSQTLLMCLGYIGATMWQTHFWMIFIAIIPIALLLIQGNLRLNSHNAYVNVASTLLRQEEFEQQFAAAFERARRYNRPLTVLLADVDNMHHLNNAHGYIMGDRVLQGVVEQIQLQFHSLDNQAFIGQWSGRTYIIALPELELQQVKALTQQICEHIEQYAFALPSQSNPIHATLSLGYAHFHANAPDAPTLIEAAHLALTRAKMTGKNRAVSADDLPHSAKVHRPTSNLAYRPTQAELPQHKTTPSPESPPIVPPRLKHGLAIYISVVAVLGGIVAIQGWMGVPIDWTRILLMAGLAVLAQFLQVELYGSTSMSVAVAISFGSLLMDGIPGAIISSAAIALAHRARETRTLDFSTFYKTIFNWGVHALASFLPVYFAKLIALNITGSNPVALIGFAILSSMQIFLVESTLMAIAMSLISGRSAYRIWQEQYRWLFSHYITLCLLGLFLAIGYSNLGILGLVAFALPVAMMHYSQRQYVSRTAANLHELRRMNEEISVANEEIKTANHSIGQLNNELFLTLSKMIDARDPFALGHASKVAQYATAIAERMQLSEAQRELIWQVSLLHDIGKLGIPENVLQKPGPLTADEFEQLKTHSQLGADLLETSHGLRHLAPYVKTHHENWAGGGYPDGIQGEAIPLETRIVTLADAVDAMASDRPYHKGLKPSMVITEVVRCRDEQFDPAVVDAFMNLIKQHGESYITNSASQVQLVRHANKHGTIRATAWPFFVNATGSAGRLEVTKRG